MMALGCSQKQIAPRTAPAVDGGSIAIDSTLSFGVVGNTVPGSVGSVTNPDLPSTSIIADIAHAAKSDAGLGFVLHLGDGVRVGKPIEWNRFQRQMQPLGDLPMMMVAGDGEARLDARYQNLETVFPDGGAEIGFNRVGSWSHFDLVSAGITWRVMILDTGKAHLGSRWNEQLNWIKRAVQGEYQGLLVFMHDPVIDLAGPELDMNPNGAPFELIEQIEETTAMAKLPLLVSAGHHASQIFMPDGRFGTMHVGAGGGGAPGEDLRRWGPADQAGRNEDVQLTPGFDLALMDGLTEVNSGTPLPQVVLDEARASGSFEGFTGMYRAEHYPVLGWWRISVHGAGLGVSFRQLMPSGEMVDRFAATFDEEHGWRGHRLTNPKAKQPAQPEDLEFD